MRESDSFGLAIEYRTIFVYFHEDLSEASLVLCSIPLADVKGRILLFQERISTLPAEVGLIVFRLQCGKLRQDFDSIYQFFINKRRLQNLTSDPCRSV